MPKAFTQHEKDAIRQRLIEQGRAHFAQYGLRKARIEELTAATGISKGAFYLFFESKESLFMEVLEEAEHQFRREVLAAVSLPGPSPQERLYRVLHKAFTLWKKIPILQLFSHGDYEVLARRVGAETMQAHLHSDLGFIDELIRECCNAGIPIAIQPKQLDGLMHTLFFASLHEDDFGAGRLGDSIRILLRLTVGYALGDISLDNLHGSPPARSEANEQGYEFSN